MRDIIKTIDRLPLLIKLIFALPGLAIFWAVYRMLRSLDRGNMVGVALAVVLLFVCPVFFWIVDVICLLLYGYIWWID